MTLTRTNRHKIATSKSQKMGKKVDKVKIKKLKITTVLIVLNNLFYQFHTLSKSNLSSGSMATASCISGSWQVESFLANAKRSGILSRTITKHQSVIMSWSLTRTQAKLLKTNISVIRKYCKY